MTIVEMANLLTKLINAVRMDEREEVKARSLTTIRNYRNAILDEFTLVKRQRDDLLVALKPLAKRYQEIADRRDKPLETMVPFEFLYDAAEAIARARKEER